MSVNKQTRGRTSRNDRAFNREMVRRRVLRTLTSPPTITVAAANAASSIAGAVTKQPLGSQGAPTTIAADPNFAWLGTPSMAYQGSPNQAYVAAPVLTGSASNARYAPSALFDFYGDKLEVIFKALATTRDYRLRVDGDFVTEHSNRLTGLTAGSEYRLIVDFGSVGHRRVQVDMDGSSFGGVAVAAAHTVSRAFLPADVPTVGLGDSITAGANTGAGAGGYSRLDSWLQTAGHFLGWHDIRNVAIAGTGYANAGADAAFTSRLADLEVPGARFVVFGGFNDGSFLITTLPDSIDQVFTKIAGQSPAEVVILGNHAPLTSFYGSSSYLGVHELLRAKAAAYGFAFVDTFAVKALQGTGNFAAPSGGGNTDVFTASDNTHPTRGGAQYLGRVYAQAIAGAL